MKVYYQMGYRSVSLSLTCVRDSPLTGIFVTINKLALKPFTSV